jgi:Mrp family chromosome partitioning ATPase
VFAVALLLTGALAWEHSGPQYRSQVVIQLTPLSRRARDSEEPREYGGSYAAFFDTQMEVVKSTAVLERCTHDRQLRQLPLLASADNPAVALRESLEVQRIGHTQLFSIGLRGESPSGLCLALNRVADAYLEHLDEWEKGLRSEERRALEAEHGKLKTEVDARTAALQRLRAAAGTAVPNGHETLDAASITQKAILELQTERMVLEARQRRLRTQLAVDTARVSGDAVRQALERDPKVQALSSLRADTHRELFSSEAVALSPPQDHVDAELTREPAVAALRQQLDRTGRALAALSQLLLREPAAAQADSGPPAADQAGQGPYRESAEAQELVEQIGRLQLTMVTELAGTEEDDDDDERLEELRRQLRSAVDRLRAIRRQAEEEAKAALSILRERLDAEKQKLRPAVVERLKEQARQQATALRARLQAIEKRIQERVAMVRPKIVLQLSEEARAKVRRSLDEVETQLAARQASETVLKTMLAEHQQQRRAADRDAEAIRALERDLGAARESLRRVERELRDIETFAVAPGHVAISSRAAEPAAPEPYVTRRATLLASAVAAASVLALLAMILADRLDTRILAPEDVPTLGGVELLGCLSHWEQPQDAGGQAPLLFRCSAAAPSRCAEEMADIMVGVLYPRGGRPLRSVLVTGPAHGSGATTLALNLAACLAGTGRRVLLIDANFLDPQLTRAFGHLGSPGLSEALSATGDSRPAVHLTDIPSLTILPAGASASASPHLLGATSLQQMLAGLAPDHDFILLDGPPLPRADAQAPALASDALILTLRARAARRHTVNASLAFLRRLDALVLGAVLMDVPTG